MNASAGNDQEHHELRMALGAYVLGQLSADEATTLEAHLDGCQECTAELAELTPVAHALGQMRRGPGPRASVAPPPELGDRVVAAVSDVARNERRRPWVGAAVLTAAAAVVAVAIAVGVNVLTRSDPAPTVPLEAVQVQTRQPGVQASADLVDHTWGVEVKLTASGFDRGGRYRVAVLGLDGTRHPAGGFVGTGTKEMDCNLNSSVLRDRASGFEVLDSAGEVVVTSAFG